MEQENVHFRHVLLFLFHKGKNATEAHRELCAVYGVGCISERTCQNWFKRFRSGNFSLDDDQRSGRPAAVDGDQLEAMVDGDRHITVREIAERLQVSHTTIENHLKRLGLVKKLDIWVPHELKEIHLTQRIEICDMHLRRNDTDPFLKRIITGDEKWVVYSNIVRKRSWSRRNEPAQTTSKADLHQKKVMLSIWWDYQGVVYFELLPRNQTINSEVYCRQLTNLDAAIKDKRPALANRRGVVFHHDNARPHTSLVTRGKLLELGWEVMSHPPYSPDLAPSDYHLFRSLQNSLNGKTFADADALRTHLVQFLAAKDKQFYERGIMQLPERWRKVIAQRGKYISD